VWDYCCSSTSCVSLWVCFVVSEEKGGGGESFGLSFLLAYFIKM